MIKIENAKKFCCEDISLIENYDTAIADTTQTWDCHHRRGTIYSKKDLKEIGEYYNRPAIELIFLTPTAHRRLHFKGVPRGPMSEANKKAIGKANSKKILQFTKSGEFLREWPSLSEASKQLKINCGHICSCCNGKYKSAGGYVWEYA